MKKNPSDVVLFKVLNNVCIAVPTTGHYSKTQVKLGMNLTTKMSQDAGLHLTTSPRVARLKLPC